VFAIPLLLFILVSGSSALDPCECTIPSFDLALKSSTAIFAGRLVKAQPAVEGKQELQFEVTRVWRGRVTAHQMLLYENPSRCSTIVFVIGTDYLIYADGATPLSLSHCTRSRRIDKANEDFLSLKQENIGAKPPRRDPFNPMKGDRYTSSAVRQVTPRTLTIGSAVIVAISKKAERHYVVLKGSDGKTHTMTEGDSLYDGTIESITANGVTFLQKSGSRSIRVTKKLHPFSQQP